MPINRVYYILYSSIKLLLRLPLGFGKCKGWEIKACAFFKLKSKFGVNSRLHCAVVFTRWKSFSVSHWNGGVMGYKGVTTVAVSSLKHSAKVCVLPAFASHKI